MNHQPLIGQQQDHPPRQHRTASLAAWVLAACTSAWVPTAQADVTVVVHASNAAALDDEAITNLFLGQMRSFPSGAEVVLINQSGGNPAAQEFASRYLKKTIPQLKAYWAKRVFTGVSRAPRELESDEDVMSYVAAHPEAIGYVGTAKLIPGVRAVTK